MPAGKPKYQTVKTDFFFPKEKLVRAVKEITANQSVKIQYLFNCHCSQLNRKDTENHILHKILQHKPQQSIPDYWGGFLKSPGTTE